jgi:DNA invertase Pin-like site-specific DNA recombinase
MRTREGMRVAKTKGRRRGTQPKLNPRQEAHLVELVHGGEYSTAEVGDLFGVARSTVYRALARSKAGEAAAQAKSTDAHPRRPRASKPSITVSPTQAADATYAPRHLHG